MDNTFERLVLAMLTTTVVIVSKLDLFITSGHYPYYKDSQYTPIDVDDEKFLLKPMNCPHHIEIYRSEPRSYRDLPLRLAEFGTVYRYEQSGELNGLTRVRGFTVDGYIQHRHAICLLSLLFDDGVKLTLIEAGAALDTTQRIAAMG